MFDLTAVMTYLYKSMKSLGKNTALSIFALIISLSLGAQTPVEQLRSDHQFGFNLRTNGIGIAYRLQPKQKLTKFPYHFSADLSSFKHIKEIKVINQSVQNPKPYVFGKQYKVAALRMKGGIEKDVLLRSEFNKLGVGVSLSGGPTLGFLKPVYLEVFDDRGHSDDLFRAVERYDPEVHTDQSRIIGYAGRRHGWSELDYRIGLSGEISANFYWTSFSNGYRGIKVGGAFDYFPGGLDIMANTVNPSIRSTAFISFVWGKQ